MSSIPSSLDAHAETLARCGSVRFLEYAPPPVASLLLMWFRFKLGVVILVAVVAALANVGLLAWGGVARGLSLDRSSLVLLSPCLVAVPVALIAWAGFAVLGRLQRSRRGPGARVLELARHGIRVSDQVNPTLPDGPRVDDAGRVLLPWTPWSDVLGSALHQGTLSFALAPLPGRVDLAMTVAQAAEAQRLAHALWEAASRPTA